MTVAVVFNPTLELDGEVRSATTAMTVSVLAGSLLICCPDDQ